MDILVGILAFFVSVAGTSGFVLDALVRDLVRSQLLGADRLEVRVEAIPSYKLVSGDIDRLRIAGRGLALKSPVRIARLDIETDAIAVDLSTLGKTPRLRRPLAAAVNVELSEADLNAALNSPEILSTLQSIRAELPGSLGGTGQPEVLSLSEPRIALLAGNEVILQARVRVEGKEQTLLVSFRAGIAVDDGVRLRLVKPTFTLNDVPVPPEIADIFLAGLNQIVDLDALTAQGIAARILKFEVVPGEMHLVGFARVDQLPGGEKK